MAWFLGERAFLGFLLFAFLGLVIGAITFYYYAIWPVSQEPEVQIKSIQPDEVLYQRFLENYNQRKERFNAADSKVYLNLFSEPPRGQSP